MMCGARTDMSKIYRSTLLQGPRGSAKKLSLVFLGVTEGVLGFQVSQTI